MIAQLLPNNVLQICSEKYRRKDALSSVTLTVTTMTELLNCTNKWRNDFSSKFIFSARLTKRCKLRTAYNKLVKSSKKTIEALTTAPPLQKSSCKLLKLGKTQVIKLIHNKDNKSSKWCRVLSDDERDAFITDCTLSYGSFTNGWATEIHYYHDKELYNKWSKLFN